MKQRTDGAVVLRLAYEAITRSGLPVENILKKQVLLKIICGYIKESLKEHNFRFGEQ